MSTMPESRINVKVETQVADQATVALFRAVWGPAGTPEAQEAALDLHLALATQASRQGPSAASSDDSPPDAASRDWWAEETREDGESWLAGDMTETERLTIPATDYHGLFDLPPTHTYGPADPADSGSGSGSGADREIDDASWDRLVDRLALERGWAVD
jgi:hypothetical protein